MPPREETLGQGTIPLQASFLLRLDLGFPVRPLDAVQSGHQRLREGRLAAFGKVQGNGWRYCE